MALNLQAIFSRTSAISSGSRFVLLLSHIRVAMGKSSELMAWFFRALSLESLIDSSLTQASGCKSCRLFSGPCEPRQVERRDARRFFLVYGSEAVLPTEVTHKSLRVQAYDESSSEEGRLDDVDRLEEARDIAVLQSAKYQQGLRRYHNRNVRGRAFLVGDLVLRKIQTTQNRHKLYPTWEGPFIIAEVTRPGAYRLQREDGSLVDNSWNIEQLRPFYT